MQRLFSSQTPKKGSFESFVPKSLGGGKSKPKGTYAEGAKKAAESSGSSSGGGKKGEDRGNEIRVEVPVPLTWLGIGALALYVFSTLGAASNARTHEISFQEFKSKLLAQGLVTKLEVVNNSTVRVYVKMQADALSEGLTTGSQGVFRYFFKVTLFTQPPFFLAASLPNHTLTTLTLQQVGSVDSFERKMDEAQASLGILSTEMVPVKYLDEVSLMAVMGQLLPTLLLIGATYWLISRQMNQIGGMGMGGMGGKGKNGQKVSRAKGHPYQKCD